MRIHVRQLSIVIAILLLLSPVLFVGFRAVRDFPAAWLQHLLDTVLLSYAFSTLGVLVGAILVAMILGGAPALLTHFFDFGGRRSFVFLQLLPLSIPTFVMAGLYMEAIPSGAFAGALGLAVITGAAAAPWVFLFMRVGLLWVPASLIEAARALGASPSQRIFRLYLPLLAAPLLAATVFVAAEAISEFGAANRLGVETMTVGLHNQWQSLQRDDVAMPIALLIVVSCTAFFLPAAWLCLRNPLPEIVSGARARPARTLGKRNAIPVQLVCLIAPVPGFLAPLFFSVTWLLEKWHRLRLSSLFGDVASSLLTAFLVVGLCLGVTLLVSLLFRVGERTGLAERSVWLVSANFFLPPLVLAFAALKIGLFAGHRLGIAAVLSSRYLPFVLIPVAETMSRAPLSLVEAARSLGRTRLGSMRDVVWPRLAGPAAAGAVLVFLESLKELTVSSLLQPFDYGALSLRLFTYTGMHMARDASSWTLCLILVSAYPIWWLAAYLDHGRDEIA